MAGEPTSHGSGNDTGTDHDGDSPPGMPRWVKVSGIIVIIAVLVVIVVLLLGGGLGDHGPGRHSPSGAAGDGAPPAQQP